MVQKVHLCSTYRIKILRPDLKTLNIEVCRKNPKSWKFLPATPYLVHFLSKVIQKINKFSLYVRPGDLQCFPSESEVIMCLFMTCINLSSIEGIWKPLPWQHCRNFWRQHFFVQPLRKNSICVALHALALKEPVFSQDAIPLQ